MTLPANKPLRRALTNRSFFSFRHSSVNKTVQASNLSEKLSKAAVTAATTAALFASVRPFFSLFSLLFKGGFWSGFILRRGIKLSFFPRHRRRRFIIVVVVFLSLFGKTPNDARLSVPGATNRCDESIRRLVVAPARFGWCKGRRASSLRSSVRRRRRRDEDKRWER